MPGSGTSRRALHRHSSEQLGPVPSKPLTHERRCLQIVARASGCNQARSHDFFQDFKPPVSTQGLLPPGNTFHVTCQQYTRGKNKASRRGEADLGSGGFLTGAERKGKKTFSSSSRPGKQPFLDDGLGPAFPPGTSTCRHYISIYGRQMLLTSTIMTTEPC